MNHFKKLYRAEHLPIFQNRMYATSRKAINCVKGDVVLVQDLRTGLIFNQAFQPKLMQYDPYYQNEQAVSQIFRTHLQDVSKIIKRHFHDRTLIEVGCGKGYFLEQVQGQGFTITGLDPAYEGKNPNILKQYFMPELEIHADGIILRHVLEHIQDPVSFLSHIRDSNGGAGKIYIEVPCFKWICKNRAWFDIFYEHVNYFQIKDFNRMFGHVYESGHTFAGQYLYVVADLSSVTNPSLKKTNNFKFPKDMRNSIDLYARRLITEHRSKHATAIWGGASKGVIFALFMQRKGAKIDFVIDINPAKQGKYLPSTGLKVYSPKKALHLLKLGSDIFVMNGNYLKEIIELTNNKYNLITVDY